MPKVWNSRESCLYGKRKTAFAAALIPYETDLGYLLYRYIDPCMGRQLKKKGEL